MRGSGSMGCSLHYCPAPQCWVACMWFRSFWLLCYWGITAVSFSLSCLCGRSSHWNDSLRSVTRSCQVCLSAYWWYQEASSICLTISPLSLINLVEAFLKFDGLGFFFVAVWKTSFLICSGNWFRESSEKQPLITKGSMEAGYTLFPLARSLPGAVSEAFASCWLLQQQR